MALTSNEIDCEQIAEDWSRHSPQVNMNPKRAIHSESFAHRLRVCVNPSFRSFRMLFGSQSIWHSLTISICLHPLDFHHLFGVVCGVFIRSQTWFCFRSFSFCCVCSILHPLWFQFIFQTLVAYHLHSYCIADQSTPTLHCISINNWFFLVIFQWRQNSSMETINGVASSNCATNNKMTTTTKSINVTRTTSIIGHPMRGFNISIVYTQ